jgi:pyridoxamine 5'-phosphate oxidase
VNTPFQLFDDWFAEAQSREPNDPNAMALATVDACGAPHARMVLLKGHGPDGFIFYTNKESDKAQQLAARAKAALLFHWKSVRRQIRIEGNIVLASESESDAYFACRGRDSQLGAWASDQSRPLDSRDTFVARFAVMEAQFAGAPVPRPPHWGGYCVKPVRFEFWQDREHRLHERRIFTQDGAQWRESLLYP